MTDLPSVDQLLEEAGPLVAANYRKLRADYPECMRLRFIFTLARHGDTYAGYADYLAQNYAAIKAEMEKRPRMPGRYVRQRLFEILKKNSNPARGAKDKDSAWSQMVLDAVIADTGLKLEVLFESTLPKGYGTPPDPLIWPQPAVEAALKKETVEAQRHFYELKKKYPNTDSDWILLLLARHIKDPIGHGPGSNSGHGDLLDHFEKRRKNSLALGAPLRALCEGGFREKFSLDSPLLALAAHDLGLKVTELLIPRNTPRRHALPARKAVPETPRR